MLPTRRSWASLLLAGLLSACAPTSPSGGPEPYFGPTLGIHQVVQRINANNVPLRTLWATHEFEARIIDKNGRSDFANGYGVLLYRKPHDLLLRGEKEIGKVFELGSNDQQYWLGMELGPQTLWWGSYANLGRPCAQEVMPIRPDAIMAVLGIADINTNLLVQPAPTMRFNNDADAYMFVWSDRAPDRWIAQKEVWYDRKTLQPRLVLLFDPDGRIILRAYLSDHQPVSGEDLPDAQRPTVATRYRLYFPETGSRMTFHLTNVRLRKGNAPSDRAFEFPTNPKVSHIVRVDEGCDQ